MSAGDEDADNEAETFRKLRELYGWHFPELYRLAPSPCEYARNVLAIQCRGTFLEDPNANVRADVIAAASSSMGTRSVLDADLDRFVALAEKVLAAHARKEEAPLGEESGEPPGAAAEVKKRSKESEEPPGAAAEGHVKKSSKEPQTAGGDGVLETKCPICMCEVDSTDTGHVNQCSHVFCYPCIFEWSKRKTSCPICNAFYTSIRRTNAQGSQRIEVEAIKESASAVVTSSDLMGLDHAYFIDECERLSRGVNHVLEGITSNTRSQNHSTYGRSHGRSAFENEIWRELQDVLCKLSAMQEGLLIGKKFDPTVLLEDLYSFEAILQRALQGPQEDATVDKVYGAHDAGAFEDEEDEEDEDGYYDDYEARLHGRYDY